MATTLRSLLKRMVPAPARDVLRGGLYFAQRVGRWPIILWQVRGSTHKDQLALLASGLLSPLVAWRDLNDWQDPQLWWDSRVVVKGIGTFVVRAKSDDLWHVVPWREPNIIREMRARLRPGDVFVDAGANIGVYSVLAAKLVGPEGKVIAIEMMPDTAARLDQHVQMNELRNVSVRRTALSDVSGQEVKASVVRGKYGQASIAVEQQDAETISVTTSTLDEITSEVPSVRMTKMDVEGAEQQALRGGEHLLRKLECLVYESLGTRHHAGDAVDSFLSGHGFRLLRLDGNNRLAVR